MIRFEGLEFDYAPSTAVLNPCPLLTGWRSLIFYATDELSKATDVLVVVEIPGKKPFSPKIRASATFMSSAVCAMIERRQCPRT